ncbi:MAG: hypothetical protein IKW13_00730 [Thermoguttaceae bacterium]|nr:hypothetical protein [Thermoguttaceae bacterium]
MKRKDLTALMLAAFFATSPTFAASQNGIPSTLETTDFAAANADFPIAADPASEEPILSATATDQREAKPSSRGSAGPERPAASREDFRNRAPVRENVGLPILDGARDRREPEPAPESKPESEPPASAESRGLGGRVADQIAERIERAVDERVEELRAKFEAERRRWTLKLFFASLGTVVAGTLLGGSVKGLTTALVRRLAALGNRVAKRLAAQALERAKKLVESQSGPQS